jgi:hypothetical protein
VKGQAPLKLQGFLPLLLRDEISLAICPAIDGANGGRATELEAEINDLLSSNPGPSSGESANRTIDPSAREAGSQ